MSVVLLQSCKNPPKLSEKGPVQEEKEKASFFPVTAYLKGQIFEIKRNGITPLKYTTINDHMDSAWLRTEDFNEEFKEFLHPEIDSTNLIALFAETRFMDRSLDAITLTYDAIGELPDTMTLKHWDVYIAPATGSVRRIYILKKIGTNKTVQLTWQSNKWCKATTIIDQPDGNSFIEKEEKITWDF